jgi:hypothetical protein
MSFFHLTKVVRDNDFFWHLKTGQWIWEHRSLPDRDPFAYTSSSPGSGRVHFILNSYWLSQVLFYLFFLAGGFPGIVILRFLIAGLLGFLMLKLRKGDKLLYISLFVMSFALILKSYPFERPQLFSFIFFGALLLLLDRFRENPREGPALFLMPLLMLLWANMHGGYALGIFVILLHIVVEGLKHAHPSLRPLSGKAYGMLVAAGVTSILISFVNPGTYHVFADGVLFQPETAIFDNVEFQPTYRIFTTYGDPGILVYWFILACAVCAVLIDRKKNDVTQVVLIACVGYFSFTAVRYLALFLIAALPVIGASFSGVKGLKSLRVFLFSAALGVGLSFTAPTITLQPPGFGGWVDDRKVPVGAADFIVQNDLQGNMYNFFNWGGYLIWRLAPERKVFIDGRTLDSMLYEQATFIDKAAVDPQSGMPVWKYFLDERRVNYLVISCSVGSRTFPLCEALLRDNEWALVFSDQTAAVFVRASDGVFGGGETKKDVMTRGRVL